MQLLNLQPAELSIDRLRVFDQILRYNIVMRVRYLIVSNGLVHYCRRVNCDSATYKFLCEIPSYGQLE